LVGLLRLVKFRNGRGKEEREEGGKREGRGREEGGKREGRGRDEGGTKWSK
jgi:hypothetical protein